MSENRILLIETPSRLSIDTGRIKINREDFEDVFVLPEDIAVMVFNHAVISLSGAVLQALTEAGSVLLVTDERHLPSGLLWPWGGQDQMSGRLRQQIQFHQDDVRGPTLWGHVVRSRLLTQALNLKDLNLNGALRLQRLAKQVKPGDEGNLEAQGARHYWKYLLPTEIRRRKRGATDPINARLNYGYAILRSLIARELASRGLHGSLGFGHSSKENPFNLADDFMEPYRFCVERQVFKNDPNGPFDANARVSVADFMQSQVALGQRVFRLPAAISETISSFIQVLEGRGKQLSLTGL